MEVICRFCQQIARYAPINEMEDMNVKVHWCDTCQAEYLRFEDAREAYSCSLYTRINDRVYRWTVNNQGDAWLWYIKEPGVPGHTVNRNNEMLLSINRARTKVTPQNVHQKIKFYLPFL